MQKSLLLAICLTTGMKAGELKQPVAKSPPKAASTVNLVYEIGPADVYYTKMTVEKSTDGSSFMACAWDNGLFGLQQYDGGNKRALIFAVWNADEEKSLAPIPAGPVITVSANENGKVSAYGKDKMGGQFMRQVPWKVGQEYQFLIDCVLEGVTATYSAWFFNTDANKWENLATFRARSGGKWLRGYNSFIEDMRRDSRSALEVRQARLDDIWIHSYHGSWVPVRRATFIASPGKVEAKDFVNAGFQDGSFVLTTGGSTVKSLKVGDTLTLPEPAPPLRIPEMPEFPFINLTKPEPVFPMSLDIEEVKRRMLERQK